MTAVGGYTNGSLDEICRNIREKLVAGVEKRLDSDAPLGFLLSGGLDSSLVCAIGQRVLKKPIRTFAVGMDTDAIDLKYAREAASFIGSDHREVMITREDVLAALEEVIAALGTFDITTIRASMGMYLLCREIRRTTNVRVLMTARSPTSCSGTNIPTLHRARKNFKRNRKSACANFICTTFSEPIAVFPSTRWKRACLSAILPS